MLSLSSRPTFALCVLAAAVSGAWAQSATPAAPEAALPAVKVRSTSAEESPTAPVTGYRATRQISATKTDTPLAETPQSVTVITRDQLDDRGVTSVADALRYSTGVVPSAFNYGGDVFTIRGFDVGVAGLYVDGLRAFANVFSSSIETYGAERVEVVRGPSSVLFGQATPGGIVNVVSKRPQAEAVNEWGIEMGTPGSAQVMADVGGALTKDGSLMGRLVFLGRDGSSEYDFVQDDRLYVAPSLTWKPFAGTTLTLLGAYNEDRNMYVWGNQYRNTGTPGNPLAPVADSFNFAGPGAGYHRTSKSLGYEFEQKFDMGLALRQKLRFSDITTDRREVWDSYFLPMLGLRADGRTLDVLAVNRPDADQTLGIDTNVEWQGRTGSVQHTLLAGIDLRRNRMTQGIYSNLGDTNFGIYQVDLYNPVFVEPDWKSMGVKAYDYHDETRSAGLYLQEQAKFNDRWVAMAGVRRDRIHQVTRSTTLVNPVTSAYLDSQSDDVTWDTTGRVGLVYLGTNGLSPYISYSTSFEPNSGTDASGAMFKPSQGKQIEIGARYQPVSMPLNLLAAIYDLRKTNVPMSAGPSSPFSVAEGEVRSRGVEFEANYEVLRGWALLANYAFTDTEVLKGDNVGEATVGIPRHAASVWTKWRIDSLVQGLSVGGGVRYVGESTSYDPTTMNPAYTLVDAMTSYTSGPWTLSASVENLADRRVLTNCTPTVCTLGYGREVKARAVYRW
jgi:iron complex outermembrane receptor protein